LLLQWRAKAGGLYVAEWKFGTANCKSKARKKKKSRLKKWKKRLNPVENVSEPIVGLIKICFLGIGRGKKGEEEEEFFRDKTGHKSAWVSACVLSVQEERGLGVEKKNEPAAAAQLRLPFPGEKWKQQRIANGKFGTRKTPSPHHWGGWVWLGRSPLLSPLYTVNTHRHSRPSAQNNKQDAS
jgi:hypothetical protein